MTRVALERNAHGARLDPLTDDRLHRDYFFVGRVPLLR
jgi:hypothetical protein